MDFAVMTNPTPQDREMEEDRASGRATHEQSPSVSAVPVGIPDAVQFVFPAMADDTMSNFLRGLTAKIVEETGANTSFGLGGSNGYGCEWDSDVFMMHPYCWCDSNSCAWCNGCDCPDGCRLHDDSPEAFKGTGFEPGMGAPNFWHKRTGVKVWWYKYIGRGMEVQGEGDLSDIASECFIDVIAQGTEARRAATTGAVHDGPVRKDAPGDHSTLYGAEPDKDGEA